MSRSAAQILTDVQHGGLTPEVVQIVETARLTMRDVVTGVVEERVVTTMRRLVPTDQGVEIV